MGKVHFTNLVCAISICKGNYPVTINYGVFINTIISFVLVAFAVFLLIKGINKLQAEKEEAAPTTKECPHCFSQIDIRATKCPNCTAEING